MDFIQTSNKAVDLFGPGKHGFGAGNPTAGVLATFFSASWANDVQQEIVNVIEGAGIAIAPSTRNQLVAAIRALVTSSFTGANQSLSLPAFQNLPGGLILQMGQLTLPASGGTTSVLSVSYPEAFPSAVVGPFFAPYEMVNSTGGYGPVMRSASRSFTGFSAVGDTNNTVTINKTVLVGWFAIGY